MKWFVVVLLLLGCLPASAKSIGTQYGDQNVRPGEGVIEAVPGDPIFAPTQAQLQGWVNDGINAASKEIGILDIPGVAASTARFPQGIACSTGRVRFVLAVTPQVVATAAGWSAAWEDDLWERIVADQDMVAAVMAGALSGNTWARDLPFLIAMSRDDMWAPIDANAVVWAYDEWRGVSLNPQGSLLDVAKDVPGRTHPTRKWAGNYVLAWSMDDASLAAPGSIAVIEGSLYRRQKTAPDQTLVERVSAPASGWRLVFGRADEYAYVDF